MVQNNGIPGITATAAGGKGSGQHYLTFVCGKEVCAVESPLVQEIIRVPNITKVPLAPPSLTGLANLRGTVIPVISLRKILNFQFHEHEENQRIIIINLSQPVGFLVDSVSGFLTVKKDTITEKKNIKTTIKKKYLKGGINNSGTNSIPLILSFKTIISDNFSHLAVSKQQGTGGVKSLEISTTRIAAQTQQTERKLVSFSVTGQDYAIDIAYAREITRFPDSFVRVPNSPPYLLGLTNWRSQLLPLISLKNLFTLHDQTENEHSRVLVLNFDNVTIGLVSDTVSEVLRVPVSQIDPVPAFISNARNMKDISQICRIDNGNKLVSIISIEHLFEQQAIQDSLTRVETMKDNFNADLNRSKDVPQNDYEQVVIFTLADDELGVNINSVLEIARLPEELTRIPNAPDFIEGVINVRGMVVPVFDLRKRLGYSIVKRNERQRIILFSVKGATTGFIVDTVTEVLKIPVKYIMDAPSLSSEQIDLLGRVANLEKQERVIQLLNPDNLLEEADRIQLEEIENNTT